MSLKMIGDMNDLDEVRDFLEGMTGESIARAIACEVCRLKVSGGLLK